MRRRDPDNESGDGDLERLLSLFLDRGIPTPRSIRLREEVDGEAIHREVLFEFADSDLSPRPSQIITQPTAGIAEDVMMEAVKETTKLAVGEVFPTLRFLLWYVLHSWRA
ncbi:MAG TPA: hypothetical protein VHG08_21545 [Longimicrobium sp.]|nr:hypothetical protein [Longimicrobium sp.]